MKDSIEHRHHRALDDCESVDQKSQCDFLQNALAKIEVAIDLSQKTLANNEALMTALNGTPTAKGWLGRIETTERSVALLTRVAVVTCAVVCFDSILIIMHLLKG